MKSLRELIGCTESMNDVMVTPAPPAPQMPPPEVVKFGGATIDVSNRAKSPHYCPIRMTMSERNTRLFTAYITGPIIDVDHYIDLIDLLMNATEQDEFIIYIDSPGGMVSSGSIVSSAIHHCKGRVTTVARGICASAACLIHNAAHAGNCIVTDMGILMIHMSSHMDSGLSTFIQERASNQVKYVRHNLLEHARSLGIISDAELDEIEGGSEIFISADEFKRRIATAEGEHDEGIFMLEES